MTGCAVVSTSVHEKEAVGRMRIDWSASDPTIDLEALNADGGHLLHFDPTKNDVWLGTVRVEPHRMLIRQHGGMTDQAVAVGDLPRRAPTGAGMNQRELACAGETSQAAVARYETGRVLPDLRTLDRLLGVCGQRLTDALPARRTGRDQPLAAGSDPAGLRRRQQRKGRRGRRVAAAHPMEWASSNLRPRQATRPCPGLRAGAARGDRGRCPALRELRRACRPLGRTGPARPRPGRLEPLVRNSCGCNPVLERRNRGFWRSPAGTAGQAGNRL